MDNKLYQEIKNIIRFVVKPKNGYKLDDLVQDTIVKLLNPKKDGSKYEEKDYRRLCGSIAANIYIDYYNKLQNFKDIYDKEPENECTQHCDLDFIIPEKHKEMYILRYKLGMKCKEISEFLNMPLGTVTPKLAKMKRDIKIANEL